jgi:murein DD-endopeptidase MepM/ murein hydrolase activator NlpD
MSKTSNHLLRAICLLILLVSAFPAKNVDALASMAPPPADMFQLPWDQGVAWYAIDGIDNGTKRPASSSHNYKLGGAVDFAPHLNMVTGENTSNFWVTAAATGTVVATSTCYVSIAHANGWMTQYQFLGNIQVKLGDAVARNQRIGIIADGVKYKYCAGYQEINVPHLHFMLRPSMIGASFAGWEVKYNSLFNSTTFTKNGTTVGLNKPLLNSMDGIVTPTATQGPATSTPTQPSTTVTATTGTPATGTPTLGTPGTPTVSPSPTATLSGPYVSTTITPQSISIGNTALVTVRLNNVPPEGYTSSEFTCTYNANLFEVSNIAVASLFGADPVSAINGPQAQSLLVAIAGSNGSKATTSDTAFTFDVKGLNPGQTVIECRARVSQGNSLLTEIPFVVDYVTIQGGTPTSNATPSITPTTGTPSFTPTPASAFCDQAEFIADVTVPPGTQVFPGTQFTKSWRLQNIGTCDWTTSYQLVFFSGEQMSAPAAASFPASVDAGATVIVSVPMTAPTTPGSYRGYWMFKNANGALFGTGPAANQPWFVDINVVDSTLEPFPTSTFTPSPAPGGPTASPTVSSTPGGPTATPIAGVAMDFAASACTATWFSGAGQLPCPGVDGDPKGFVLLLTNPKLESGVNDTRPGLLTHPQDIQNGYIQGFYPAFRVQSGDRFRSTISCEFGATDCYLAYRLDYQVGSDPIKTFWGPWLERYEGQGYSIDVDLSSLAGKDVKFILTVLAAGQATDDRALWVNPIIYRAGSVSTAVPSATPGGDWLTFTNSKYGFMFGYPGSSQIVAGGTDNYTRINLPFTPGTNLSEKYLEVSVAENPIVCQSPLASSGAQTSETVVISGITFLKQTAADAGVGHLHEWVAYSTSRNNACVSLGFVLHSLNPDNFATPPVVFDKAAESMVFGQIISTYSWLAVTPTNTATITPLVTSSPTPGVTSTSTVTPPPSAGNVFIAGQVVASKPVVVNVYDTNMTLVATMETNLDDSFRFEVAAGTYTVVAVSEGFLRAQATETINAGVTRILPPITLIAGDIDGNNVVDQFDALTIGMSYNSSTPAAADLNNDGTVNVLDLEALAKNYRKTGPIAW